MSQSRPSQLRICEVACFAWAHVRAPASVSCDHCIQDHGQPDSVSAEQERRRRSKTAVDEVPREIQEKHRADDTEAPEGYGLGRGGWPRVREREIVVHRYRYPAITEKLQEDDAMVKARPLRVLVATDGSRQARLDGSTTATRALTLVSEFMAPPGGCVILVTVADAALNRSPVPVLVVR